MTDQLRRRFLGLTVASVVSIVVLHYLMNAHRRDSLPDNGWDELFERSLANTWLVLVGRTGSMTRPLKQPGVHIVFVGSLDLSGDIPWCRPPDCIYLGIRNQSTFANKITSHLTPSTYSKRLLGYLYAVSKGANVIYTKYIYNRKEHTPNRTLTIGNTYTVMEVFLDREVTSDMKQAWTKGQSDLVPWFMYHKYTLLCPESCVQASSLNTGGKRTHNPIGFTMLYSSIASYKYSTFWGLLFHSLYGALGKILIQRLLSEIRGGDTIPRDYTDLLFTEAPWKHEENMKARNYSWEDLTNLRDTLLKWKCDNTKSFFGCVRDIANTLVHGPLWAVSDVELVHAWLSDLESVGYSEPLRSLPAEGINTAGSNLTQRTHSSRRPGQISFSEQCPDVVLTNADPIIKDIGLIIAFNEATFYYNIPLLESMYRGYFKHIVYCGPEIGSFTHHASRGSDIVHLVFIEAYSKGWYFYYECLMLAMQLNLDVNGFIQIGDDTLLNPWNVVDLPRNTIWLHKGMDKLNLSLDEIEPEWQWWTDEYGKPAILETFNDINSLGASGEADDIFLSYIQTFERNSENYKYVFRQGCDFIYLPMIFKRQYIQIASVFLKHEVMVELAHANIVMGLQPSADILKVEDGSLWMRDQRTFSVFFYNKTKLFLHPFKLGTVEKHTTTYFFCNVYFRESERYLRHSIGLQ
ncbi:uncharacterized protein LOC124117363 [Haliotis rufescens]|uniref:uncharacterized protein LOC124117363 n=1 Tax=Haliotis rufescens TaxID=6454 RepID=UPI00201EB2BA|nr:uncharacterized protein LOC124117363 [Haliotis rufescens]